MPSADPDRNPIIRKLQVIAALSPAERAAAAALPVQVVEMRADQDIIREGDRPTRCFAILAGLTCAYKVAAEGRRQIVGFHIAGDMPDVLSLHLPVLDNSFSTITSCRIGFIQHDALRDLCDRFPRLAGAFWRETLIDAAIFREWMTSIGRRMAPSRIAHLICEMAVRMRAVGLADGNVCDLPITQTELGDALGLSNVHVNRSLKELRSAGLISQQGSVVRILDWDRLRETGDFDPAYLHLRAARPA